MRRHQRHETGGATGDDQRHVVDKEAVSPGSVAEPAGDYTTEHVEGPEHWQEHRRVVLVDPQTNGVVPDVDEWREEPYK